MATSCGPSVPTSPCPLVRAVACGASPLTEPRVRANHAAVVVPPAATPGTVAVVLAAVLAVVLGGGVGAGQVAAQRPAHRP